jgi:hypothetical protein
MLASSPHQSTTKERAVEGFEVSSIRSFPSADAGADLSDLRIERNDHNRYHAFGRQLLALHQLRRRVERIAGASQSLPRAAVAMTSAQVLRDVRDLVAALDQGFRAVCDTVLTQRRIPFTGTHTDAVGAVRRLWLD